VPSAQDGQRRDRALTTSRPGPRSMLVVHRLDLGQSGRLVHARTEAADRALSPLLQPHNLTRQSLARLPRTCGPG